MVSNNEKGFRQLHIRVPNEVYERCRRLIAFEVYKSFSDLIRAGIDEILEKEGGYEKEVEREANERFSENDLSGTRIKIDGTIMRLRVNSKWWHRNAKAELMNLIEDLHIPGPISVLEEKYGTKIVLMTLDDDTPLT